MRDIFIRPAVEKDIQQLDSWLKSTPQNLFDSKILEYGDKLKFWCAHNGEPIVFMPVQNVLMLESLAVRPEASALDVAKSIAELIKYVICRATEMGYNELYFISRDESVSAFARRHGFEELLADKEKQCSLFFWRIQHG